MKTTKCAFSLTMLAAAVLTSSFANAADQDKRVAFFSKAPLEQKAAVDESEQENTNAFFNKAAQKKDLLENESASTSAFGLDAYQTDDGATEIRVSFNGFPITPTAKKVSNPDKLILDFGKVGDELQKKLVFKGTNQVKALNFSRNDQSHLILTVDLNEFGRFTTRKVDGSFFLKIYPGVKAETKVAVSQTKGVSGLQFKRTKGGEDQAILDLLSSDTPVAVKQNGNKVELRFKGNKLPAHLLKTQNFNDLKAIISSSRAYNQGFDGVVELTMNGSFEYMAFQVEKKLTINVAQKKAGKSTGAAVDQNGYSGRKISMDFQDVEIRRVLQMVANYVGVNIVTSDAVTGNVSLRVQDVPWDQALSIMLKSKGLSQRRDGKVIWVAPTTEVAKQETEEAKAYAQSITMAPLVTSIIQLNYANAAEISKLIAMEGVSEQSAGGDFNRQLMASRMNANGDDSRLLSPRGVVGADSRTNTLIVLDTQQKVDEIKRIVAQLDIPVRQVMVEARIVRATTNFSKNMGVKWGIAKDSGVSMGANMNNLYSGSKYGRANEAETIDSVVALDLGQAATTSSVAFGLINTTDKLLGLELSALQSDGLGEVLSTPKVLTGDKQEATIRSGVKLPYKTASQDQGTNTTFQDAILELTVTPSITPEGTVQMKLVINKDSQGQLTDAGYAIDTNKLVTNVLVNDGETVVLGGLYEDTKTNSIEKVPFLGDIPFLGKAFQSKSKNESKQELLIFITPKIHK